MARHSRSPWHRRPRLVCVGFLAVALAPTGCADGAHDRVEARRAAVVAGMEAPDEPSVVALERSGRVFCTGTLVHPRLVLTAAHCLSGGVEAIAATAEHQSMRVRVSARVAHPDFDVDTLGRDVALLVLEASLDGVPAIPIATRPVSVGESVRVVGFGRSEHPAQERRAGVAAVTRVSALSFELGPAPALPCDGDSGGPVLTGVGRDAHVAGVVSSGDGTCKGVAVVGRADALGAWVAAVAHDVTRGAPVDGRPVGESCASDAACATALCARPTGDRGVCARRCEGETDGSCDASRRCLPSGRSLATHACLTDAEAAGSDDAAPRVVDGEAVRPAPGCLVGGARLVSGPMFALAALVVACGCRWRRAMRRPERGGVRPPRSGPLSPLRPQMHVTLTPGFQAPGLHSSGSLPQGSLGVSGVTVGAAEGTVAPTLADGNT